MNHRQSPTTRRQEGGFTVIEMVVTLAILVVVLLAALQLFEGASKVTRVQIDTADMQQSMRIAQYDLLRMLRMAGRGGVPLQVPQPPLPAVAPTWSVPNGIAVAVQNNANATTYVDAPANNHKVLAGTDVLTIRGVLSTPVFTVLPESLTITSTSALNGGGSFTVAPTARPNVPVPQNLRPFTQACAANRPEALVLISPLDSSIYQIVELASCDAPAADGSVKVFFKIGGGTYTTQYWQLSNSTWDTRIAPGAVVNSSGVAYVGIVEEYRYYVEDLRETTGNAASPVKPRLLRARTYPGTADAWDKTATDAADRNWIVPMADNIADLQVALGIESGGDPFSLVEDGTAADEWLFNNTGDLPTDDKWRFGRLQYVRVTTTAFAERRDLTYASPTTAKAEDHSYSIPALGTASATTPDATYRRRTLRTAVDLRNL